MTEVARRARYFSDAEFACRCLRPECEARGLVVTQPLLTLLDAMRTELERPIFITSGLRCAWWNAKEGGDPQSAHLDGTEADLACESSALRYQLLVSAFRHGAPRVGIGNTFLHVGVSLRLPRRVAWTYYPTTPAAALRPDDPRVC